jgi:hypothetical protein
LSKKLKIPSKNVFPRQNHIHSVMFTSNDHADIISCIKIILGEIK